MSEDKFILIDAGPEEEDHDGVELHYRDGKMFVWMTYEGVYGEDELPPERIQALKEWLEAKK